jgi:hypothetical protein
MTRGAFELDRTDESEVKTTLALRRDAREFLAENRQDLLLGLGINFHRANGLKAATHEKRWAHIRGKTMRKFWQSAGSLVLLLAAQSASAMGGWYLLLPPTNEAEVHGEYAVLDAKPLSQWTQEAAYDSAVECEVTKTSLLDSAQKFHALSAAEYAKARDAKGNQSGLGMLKSTAERSHAYIKVRAASRCIKSDDPRLGR